MKKRSKKKKIKILLRFTIFFIIVFSIMNLPLFNVNNVVVNGSNTLSDELILETTQTNNYAGNIFYYAKNKYEKELMKNPYIEAAEIDKVYPDTLSVKIEEREVIAYVMYSESTYLYIDKEGNVLEVKNSFSDNLPVIIGLDIDGYTVGKLLNLSDDKIFNTTLKLSNLFKRYEISDSILRVDLNDVNNIIISTNNMRIIFGSVENADEKMQRVASSLGPIEEIGLDQYNGYYHVEDITKNSYFELIR